MTIRNKPLVSVIVPVYQVEETLRECLDSIEGQTYGNLDIILVDDGSTDGSAAICKDYASKDGRVRILTRQNGGLAAARNTGLDNILGSFVLFVDSDDIITPNHVSALVNLILQSECDIAITNLTPFHDERPSESIAAQHKEYSGEEAAKTIFYQGEFDTCAPAKLYRAELWDGSRFPEGYIHEDLPTVYSVVMRAKNVSFFEGATYGYRFNPGGLNHSKTTSAKVRTLDLVKGIIGEMERDAPNLVRPAECFYLSFCFHLLLNADHESISAKERTRLAEEIRTYRRHVLFDGCARKKTRIACLLSYGGMGLLKRAFKLTRGD